MFTPAFTAVRYKEKSLVNLYNRTFERHGIKMKSYVAVQKKLLVLIYHLWKKNEQYNPNYQEKSELEIILDTKTKSKNSPNLVEAIPDKQLTQKEEVFSII